MSLNDLIIRSFNHIQSTLQRVKLSNTLSEGGKKKKKKKGL